MLLIWAMTSPCLLRASRLAGSVCQVCSLQMICWLWQEVLLDSEDS